MRVELIECLHAVEHNGSAESLTNLADCYKKLQNDSLNEEIVRLYARAGALGFAPAQNALGVCYITGMGVEKILKKHLSGAKKLQTKD